MTARGSTLSRSVGHPPGHSALATWYGLVRNTADPECGSIDKAIERLDFLWKTFACATPIERSLNSAVGMAVELKAKGVPLPGGDPYGAATDVAMAGLSMLGARDEYLSFPALLNSLCPDFAEIDWEDVAKSKTRMLAGAIEIHSGNFEAFDSHKTLEDMGLRPPREHEQSEPRRWRMRRPLSLEGVAASGTLPEVLRAQRIANSEFPTCTPGKTTCRDAYYWDGLYSQNPPVRPLLDADIKEEKPDEIWVVRINPQEMNREVTSIEDIHDRVNDLAGNVSLNAELDHILSINNWLKDHRDDHPSLAERRIVEVRTIKMRRESAWGLRSSTKLDRSRRQMEALYDEGRAVANEWLANWRERGRTLIAIPTMHDTRTVRD